MSHYPVLMEALIGALLWFYVGALGLRLGVRLPSLGASVSCRVAQAFGLGGLALSLLGLVLSLLHVLQKEAMICLLILSLRWVRLEPWVQLLRRLYQQFRAGNRWLCCLIGLAGLASVVSALVPCSHFDTQVYHYTLPRLYLEQATVYWTQTSVYDGMFHGLHLLYCWPMALGGEVATNLSGPYFLTILALSVGGSLQRLAGNQGPSWLGMALVMTSPVIFLQSSGGLPDLASAAYCALALQSWLVAQENHHNNLWRLTGLWVSAACAIRISAAPMAVALAVASLSMKPRRWRSVALLLGWSLLLWFPWFCFNSYHTGWGLYPMGVHWKVQRINQAELGHSAVAGMLVRQGPSGWRRAMSPLLTTGVIFFLGTTRRSQTRLLIALAAFYVACQTLGVAGDRYTLAGISLAVLASSLGWSQMLTIRGRFGHIALSLGLTVGAATCWASLVPKVLVLLNLTSRDEYILARQSSFAAYQWFANSPYQRALLSDIRAYRCPKTSTVIDQEPWDETSSPWSQNSPRGLVQSLMNLRPEVAILDFNQSPMLEALAREHYVWIGEGKSDDTFPSPDIRCQLDWKRYRATLRGLQFQDEQGQWLPWPWMPAARLQRRALRLQALLRLTRDCQVLYAQGGVVVVDWPSRKALQELIQTLPTRERSWIGNPDYWKLESATPRERK